MTFVLDLESNPHPKMLARALALRAAAQDPDLDDDGLAMAWSVWSGYVLAMCDATGVARPAMEKWLEAKAGQE